MTASGGAPFELKIRHRAGPITLVGAFGHIDGTIALDQHGSVRIDATVDLSRLELDSSRDPRVRKAVLAAIAGKGAVRLTATGIAADPDGLDAIEVTGSLVHGDGAEPISLSALVTFARERRELTVRMIVDHRRLGLVWITGPLKAPTELVLRASLVPRADSSGSVGVARKRRPKLSNSRYRVMARRPRFSPDGALGEKARAM